MVCSTGMQFHQLASILSLFVVNLLGCSHAFSDVELQCLYNVSVCVSVCGCVHVMVYIYHVCVTVCVCLCC